MSDSDDDINVAAHGKLISSIQSLDGKKKQKNDIRGIPVAPHNLHLVVQTSRDSSQISAADIKFKEKGDKVLLETPKSSGEMEKAQRQIAREIMVTDTTQWDPIVRSMRLAPQINYVKHNEGITIKEKPKAWGFVPTTPLEKELFAALGNSEDVLRPNKEFTVAEEKALKAMSISEAKMRRNELMKHQELLTRAGSKAKRLKKIKSKKYRKILRKEKQATDRKELEQMQKTDPEAFVERMELLDRARMEERLTLKHKGGGKFSRLHKAYSKFDDKTRTAVQDMLQKSKELTKKRQDSSDSEEEEMDEEQTKAAPASDENSDEEDIGTVARTVPMSVSITKPKSITKLAGGWLDGPTKYVYNTKEKDVQEVLSQENQDATEHATEDEIVVEEKEDDEALDIEGPKVTGEENNVNKKSKKRKRKKKKSPEDEECEKPDVEAADETKPDGDQDGGEPKKKKRKRVKKKNKNHISKELEEQNALKPVKETILQAVEEKEEENEEEEVEEDKEDNMKVSMEELFQDEDFVEEFARDTAELEAKMRPKMADTKLPGWGSWAGPDFKEKQKKIAEAKLRKQPFKRNQIKKDPAVWLNPNRNDNIRKYQPKSVPFPYQSVNQYEASLRQPVSRGFVRETAHKLLTKPEMVTKLGHIIQPLDKGLIVKKQAQFA